MHWIQNCPRLKIRRQREKGFQSKFSWQTFARAWAPKGLYRNTIKVTAVPQERVFYRAIKAGELKTLGILTMHWSNCDHVGSSPRARPLLPRTKRAELCVFPTHVGGAVWNFCLWGRPAFALAAHLKGKTITSSRNFRAISYKLQLQSLQNKA